MVSFRERIERPCYHYNTLESMRYTVASFSHSRGALETADDAAAVTVAAAARKSTTKHNEESAYDKLKEYLRSNGHTGLDEVAQCVDNSSFNASIVKVFVKDVATLGWLRTDRTGESS